MKKLIAILFCIAILTSGAKFEKRFKTGIIFNEQPFTKETANNYSRKFERGKKIYWLFMSKKDIKAQFIRVQVLRANHKTGFATISGIVYTHEYRINRDTPHYFTDYFVMHTPGHYYVQIFDMNQLYKPLVIGDFYVR